MSTWCWLIGEKFVYAGKFECQECVPVIEEVEENIKSNDANVSNYLGLSLLGSWLILCALENKDLRKEK